MPVSWEIIAPLVILDLILKVTALISCVKEEKTNGPKWLWAVIILCISMIGSVLYFVAGRRKQG